MTTNTNDTDRVTLLIAAARALNLADVDLYDVLDTSIDAEPADYDDDEPRRALHTLAASLYSSDDDFDDLRLDMREALDMLSDDDIELRVALNHPYVSSDPI